MNSNEDIIKSYVSSPQSLISFMVNSRDSWTIKDCESRYIYMNEAVMENINVPKNFDVEGKLDKEIPIKLSQELWPEIVAYEKKLLMKIEQYLQLRSIIMEKGMWITQYHI